MNDIINLDFFKTLHQEFFSNHISGGKFFLTGGTGFFGKWILNSIRYLNDFMGLRLSASVLSRSSSCFVKQNPCFKKRYFHFIEGDITHLPQIDGPFDYIIHAATPVTNAVSDEEIYSTIVDGTRQVLNFAKLHTIKKILYISSGAIYGKQPSSLNHVPESFPYAPNTAYGMGKKQAEDICLNSSVPVSIARGFAYIGPYLPLDNKYAIGNFINDVIQNKDIIIKGDGRPYRSYMYAADLVLWLWTILLKGENGMAYNVGSDKAISIAELAHKVAAQEQGYSGKIIIQKEPDWNIPAPRYVPDTTLARESLGLKEHFTLEEGIQKTMTFARQEQIRGNK